ncbi:legumain-like [Oratosquilla oratoria]|uniref:legumain-like n=1 Tax=Oratosquilla oratoria TaxID=337810 RepID=UPI003F76E19B
MKVVVLALLVSTCLVQGRQLQQDDQGTLWAVLVAGSSSWFNYRHQADVCHAYQILHKHGIPDENIIVMMADDIAHNSENPHPGVIINRPNGPNVYEGVLKDYTGLDVTPENFLNILAGNEKAMAGIGSGKVIKSGPNDRIFVNLVDHGAPGIFGFPSSYLYARDLNKAIKKMKEENKFKEMTLYVEACESGSLFEHHLPKDINVYALSASSPSESSYACYLDDELDTYLGDVFSIKWMEDTDREDITKETLEKQFKIVHKETTTSDVMEWGQLNINAETVSTFQGSGKAELEDYGPFYPSDDPCLNSSVSNPDAPRQILRQKIDQALSAEEADIWRKELEHLNNNRKFVRDVLRDVVYVVAPDAVIAEQMLLNVGRTVNDWDCYEQVVESFHKECFNLGWNPYALRHLYTFINMCDYGFAPKDVIEAHQKVCTHPPVTDIQ